MYAAVEPPPDSADSWRGSRDAADATLGSAITIEYFMAAVKTWELLRGDGSGRLRTLHKHKISAGLHSSLISLLVSSGQKSGGLLDSTSIR